MLNGLLDSPIVVINCSTKVFNTLDASLQVYCPDMNCHLAYQNALSAKAMRSGMYASSASRALYLE